jgi:hypothetical protein
MATRASQQAAHHRRPPHYRHPGYDVNQRRHKRIEEVFGWINRHTPALSAFAGGASLAVETI